MSESIHSSDDGESNIIDKRSPSNTLVIAKKYWYFNLKLSSIRAGAMRVTNTIKIPTSWTEEVTAKENRI